MITGCFFLLYFWIYHILYVLASDYLIIKRLYENRNKEYLCKEAIKISESNVKAETIKKLNSMMKLMKVIEYQRFHTDMKNNKIIIY